jgi:hypothetical protein
MITVIAPRSCVPVHVLPHALNYSEVLGTGVRQNHTSALAEQLFNSSSAV